MLTTKLHRYIYLFGMILLGVSIPFSEFLMSISQFILATNWLLELDFKNKWKRLKSNYPALCLIALFLIHVIWMIGSEDITYGLKDLRIKLPLLILPLMIGSSKYLKNYELKTILHFFLVSIVVSTAISGCIYFGLTGREINNYRSISIFISHIRLSLLTIMGIFIAYYYAKHSASKFRLFYYIIIIWLTFFIYILGSYSGLVILLLTIFIALTRLIIISKNRRYRIVSLTIIVSITALVSWESISIYQQFYQFDNIPKIAELESHSIQQNPYQHRPNLDVRENGHLVYVYVCSKELEKGWNKRSNIKYSRGLDAKGNPINLTLYHYLTSLNYRKDSIGLSKLSEKDIKMIEKGYSNYIYKNKHALYTKAYPILMQLYRYQVNAYANGGTITQRLEYLKVAKAIIKDHFWLGTGTSDVKIAFNKKYDLGISKLPKNNRLRAHNQFVTFFISFGLLGFLISLFLMLSPFFKISQYHFLAFVFFIVAYISMLNEDTLETQAGVTFFSFFYIVLLVATKQNRKKATFNKIAFP